MPTISGPPSKWEELGKKLERRRVERDPRYKDRAVFARDTGVNDRMLGDLERARRTVYRDTSLHAVEIAYRLKEDAIRRFVSGKADQLEALPDDELAEPAPTGSDWDGEITGPGGPLHKGEVLRWRDLADRRVWELEMQGLTYEAQMRLGQEPGEVIDVLRQAFARRVAAVNSTMMERAHGQA